MQKYININELETSFNYILQKIRQCFCDFTPQAMRLNKHLKDLTSDINFVKNLSYSFKYDIEQLKEQYTISEHINHQANANIYDLEIRLVNLAKHKNKNEILYLWFTKFAETKNYIIENSTTKYVSNNNIIVDEWRPEIRHNAAKLIKFNHLL